MCGVLGNFICKALEVNRHNFLFCIAMLLFGCSAFAQIGRVETGIASFYHDKFVGRRTANGEIYSQEKMTAAHKSLPLGTWVKVTNLSNDSTVIVRINDRMPQYNKRSIDLTEMAAGKLNFIPKGLTKVRIEVIPAPDMKLAPRDLPTSPLPLIACRQIHSTLTISIVAAPGIPAPAITESKHAKKWFKRRL